jgi:RHS repeat-associated protein
MFEEANNSTSAGTWTPPTGMTSRATQAAGNSLAAGIADKALTSTGTTGSQTAGFSISAQLVGVLIALKPAQTTYSYDLKGNRTGINPAGGSTVGLTYDQANRLTGYGVTATYAYNGDGLRMSKTVSGTTNRFIWDVAEGLPLLLVDGTANYVYGPGGLPLEQVTASATLYYYHDQLGTTRALATGAGSVTATYTYDTYGRLTGSSGGVTNPFGYAGQYTDNETGFVYLRARYYDPSTSQFISRDPVVAITRLPYQYALDNPNSYSDPSGNCGEPLSFAFCVGAIVVIVATLLEAVVSAASQIGATEEQIKASDQPAPTVAIPTLGASVNLPKPVASGCVLELPQHPQIGPGPRLTIGPVPTPSPSPSAGPMTQMANNTAQFILPASDQGNYSLSTEMDLLPYRPATPF